MEKKTLLRAILKHGPMLHNEELKNVLAYEDGEIVDAEPLVEIPVTETETTATESPAPTKTVGDVMDELYA
jgi:hypothetical protein